MSAELIEKLELADRGSSELDEDVARHFGWTSEPDMDATPRSLREEGKYWLYWTDSEGYGNGNAPYQFTLSLDAVLRLMPKGYGRFVDATLPEAGIDVGLYPPGAVHQSETIIGSHNDEILATCIALVKAKAYELSAKT